MDAQDAINLTQQAMFTALLLGAPILLAGVLVGLLIGLAAFVYFIALLYTTATSPTKQGIHDRYAATIVARSDVISRGAWLNASC